MKTLLTLLVVLVTPSLALAAPLTFKELVNDLVFIMDLIVPTMVAAAVVIYFFGIAQNVLNFGDSKNRGEKMKSFYGYGLLVLFIMVSVWGILRLMVSTFFSADNSTSNFGTQGESVNLDCRYGSCE